MVLYYVAVTQNPTLIQMCGFLKKKNTTLTISSTPQDIANLNKHGYPVRQGLDSLLIIDNYAGSRRQIDGMDEIVKYIRSEQLRVRY